MQEMQETQVQSLGQEDPLEEGMATRSNILAWGIPWTKKSYGLQSVESPRVGHDWSDLAHTVFSSLAPSFQKCLSCVQPHPCWNKLRSSKHTDEILIGIESTLKTKQRTAVPTMLSCPIYLTFNHVSCFLIVINHFSWKVLWILF